MKLFNLFKKKRSSFEITAEKCQKARHIGQELNVLLHPQMEEILSRYYQKELSSSHFLEKKEKSDDVFELACVGLSIINLIDLVEKSGDSSDLVKKCLRYYQEIYAEINKSNIYNQLMKYIQDYKYFIDSDAPTKIQDKDIIMTCFTGAWVIRYYLGEEANLPIEMSLEIGKIIEENIHDLWITKK